MLRRDPPVTNACLPLSVMALSFPDTIAAITRPMSKPRTGALRPVLTRSTTPRISAPAPEIRTTNVLTSSGSLLTRPLYGAGRLPPVTGSVKSRVKGGSGRVGTPEAP